MKNSLAFILLFLCLHAFAQDDSIGALKYLKITQKHGLQKKGCQFVLKEVLSDSRCPKGVSCIWAGETTVVVSVYKDQKRIEDHTITISDKYSMENAAWFAKYMPSDKNKVKSSTVFPYPKEGRTIDPKAYYLKIGYVK